MKQIKQVDLMIIGAQKAGTTSLKNYLNQHPEILGHPQTEFTWFADNDSRSFNEVADLCFTEGNNNKTKAVVAKNVAIYYDENAIKKLYDHNPDCKLVFIIRHPVERAYSAYTMEISNGWLKRDFEELKQPVLQNDKKNGLSRLFFRLGLYSDHLKMIYKYFPEEQVRVFTFEQLKTKPSDVCRDLFEWLNIDVSFVPDMSVVHNKTQKVRSGVLANFLHWLRNPRNPLKRFAKWILPYNMFTKLGIKIIEFNKNKEAYEPISQDMRDFLIEQYKPYNKELEKITGLDLSEWER